MLTSPLFSGANAATLDIFRKEGVRHRYTPGQTIFHEGDRPAALIVIVSGQVRIWRSSAAGQTTTIHMLGAGDVPGCVAVFRGIAYPATATAIDVVQTLHLPIARLRALFQTDAQLAANALAIVGHRNADMLERLLDVSTQGVEQRLARAVLRLAAAAPHTDAQSIELRLSRQDLAELTATTLHTVSRFVSRWEDAGIVAGGRGRVIVRDRAALTAIANLD